MNIWSKNSAILVYLTSNDLPYFKLYSQMLKEVSKNYLKDWNLRLNVAIEGFYLWKLKTIIVIKYTIPFDSFPNCFRTAKNCFRT